MPYLVPQFIEREAKVIGPFTFKQFIFIGIAGAFCFALYFMASLLYFILGTTVLMGGTLALVFIKIKGRSLPIILKNYLMYLISPKIYLWKKKPVFPKIVKKEEIPKEEEIAPTPKIAGRSRLKQLSTQLETRIR